ncbi:MAG TPA: hypothetical protein VH639_17565 [Bryobacteraceae bacterium]|jgi:hypothetical protein
MNDTELDRLLETWEAPTPRPSLRHGLRARFPRAERLGFVRPLRWALAILVASVALVIGMAQAQSSYSQWDFGDLPVVSLLHRMFENFMEGREARRVEQVVAKIRQSDPKVYVDGQLVAPLEFGPAKSMDVEVPGEGLYSIVLYRFTRVRNAAGRPTGWVEAGRIHDSVIEFQAGGKMVRIECDRPIVGEDRPVFAMRRR